MAEVTIYTKELCGFCARAKALLERKGAAYHEIDVTYDPEKRSEMMRLTGGARTVPQIFISNQLIGGCDELFALESNGALGPLLARP